jgi:hypothetical protein
MSSRSPRGMKRPGGTSGTVLRGQDSGMPGFGAIDPATDFGANQVWLSLADFNRVASPTPQSGTITVCSQFLLFSAVTSVGCRFWYPGTPDPAVIRCKLWRASDGALLATVDVPVTAARIYIGKWANVPLLAYTNYEISMFETSGTNFYRGAAISSSRIFAGPNMIWTNTYGAVSGDIHASGSSMDYTALIDPMVTVP